MSLSYYSCSVPVFEQFLQSLDGLLYKLAAHTAARKIDEGVYLAMRLYPDMLPFSRQVQICCDFAKNTCARIAAVEPPKHEDTEKSVADLKERVAKALAYVRGFKAEQFAGLEERAILMNFGTTKVTMQGPEYLHHFALPNFFFHLCAAYGILRHGGVEIGKRDFMGTVPTFVMETA